MTTWLIVRADVDPDAADYHLYAQWAAAEQLGRLAANARTRADGLYLDFPVGVHPDGFDVWRQPALFAREVSTGAPPDALFCGEAAAPSADLIRGTFGADAKIAAAPPPTRRAAVLASLGYAMLQEGRVADALTLEPLYLRSSQVSTANRTWQNR